MRARALLACAGMLAAIASCAIGCGAANAGQPGAGTGGTDSGSGGSDAGSVVDGKVSAIDGGVPAGWLYTQGNKIYVSNGSPGSGTPWMGRGVNMDDLYLCGFDNNLQMATQTPNAESTLKTTVSGLMSSWHPTFVRM